MRRMNKELLRQVADVIEQESIKNLKFDMCSFRGTIKENEICKTVACIAGHTVYIHDGRTELMNFRTMVSSRAETLLGLNNDQAMKLFYAVDASRQEAADTIRHLIDTGKVDWKYKRRFWFRLREKINVYCKIQTHRTETKTPPSQAGNSRLGREAESTS